ncbi:MAG: hypothetical protein EA377_09185 [Phycisphaerales bacterium]|nr:MAG: hypothetical protein EA377_09185 [Phycisphaerales bacterium]
MGRAFLLSAIVMMWLVVPLGLSGCQQALFPKDAPRTQFESHRQMRGQTAPLEEPDVFGNPQPALRARLAPR